MRINELINELEKCKKQYGDCEVCKIRMFSAQPIDYVKFIGGNRILLLIYDTIEKDIYKSYMKAEEHKNNERKKEWIKACEQW